MTNAELITKIKEEIERRIKELGFRGSALIATGELKEILSFLDTISVEE